MLAYVFWHWRRPEVDVSAYRERLVAFQRALGSNPPEGLLSTAVFRSGGSPWVGAEESFEDWYVTRGSAALDPLNEAAVSGSCREPHDRAARAAMDGTAGLYRLRQGSGEPGQARWAAWFAKPAGMAYADLFERLEPLTRSAAAGLWGRQMTLGPTPEFCLLAPGPLALPAGLAVHERRLERIWPEG